MTWWRRWTHPLATVCAVHRAWLTPVSTSALRRIRHAGGFGGFATWPGDVEELPVEVPADLVIDALWLQNRCQQRGPVRSAWGSASPVQLVNVAGTLAQLLMSADAGLELPTPRRFGCDGEPVKIFTIEGSGRCSHWTLPGRLRQRQRMLGELGEVLRCGPTATASLPAAVVRQLARSCTKDWPAAALQWICPRAVDVMRHDAELSCAVLPGLHSLD